MTVTAGSSGLQLSAPDGKASCTGFGVAWHSGMLERSSPCTISFNRSSAHLGGATPLTIKVAYSASYSARSCCVCPGGDRFSPVAGIAVVP